MLNTMHDELRRCMQLTGCRTVKDITKASLGRVNADGLLKSVEGRAFTHMKMTIIPDGGVKRFRVFGVRA